SCAASTSIFARSPAVTTAVPQPNLTKSMYSAADETRSAKCATPIPPSMTIVRPFRRGLAARDGKRKAVGFIVTPSHLDLAHLDLAHLDLAHLDLAHRDLG